jgi:uncharacterized RDD family membrane protein YckC
MLFVAQMQHAVKVSVVNRVIAKVIDLLICIAVAAILPYPLGPLLGFLYSVFADGIHTGPLQGQSLGKKLLNLQVVNIIRKRPATYKDSFFRNLPVGIATFFAIIPVWGWLILALLGLPLMAMEIYLMLKVESGHRLGDVMGDTEVVDCKVDRDPS